MCREILSRESATFRFEVYAKRILRISTHKLRYARITHMMRNNVSSSMVAKITGHKRLNHVSTYA